MLEQEEPETVADLNRALLARALLERVEPSTRSVVLGVLGAGLRHEDAAAALGMSPAAVARRIQRFLASTREYMTRSEYLEAQGPGTSPTASGARRPLAVAPVKPPTAEAKPPPPARAAAPSRPWRHLDPDLESAA